MKGRRQVSGMSILMIVVTSLVVPLFAYQDSYAYPTVYPTGTTIYEVGKTFNGYTLFRIKVPNRILLIDMDGEVVHSWEHGNQFMDYPEPLPNGNLLVNAFRSPLYGLVELDWDANIVWEVFFEQGVEVHHDFERLANGNTLVLCRRLRNVPAISPRPVLDDYIVEVDPSGTTVREWYTSDHFDELGFSGIAKLLISMSGGDWSHTNSIHTLPENSTGDPRFKPGNILVSQRSTNIVFIIDKDTGAIVWKYGPGNSLLVGQHDAKMIEEGYSGAGNILLFDNGGRAGYPTKTRGFSRVLEVDPLSMQIVWQYTAAYSGLDPRRFYSGTISSAQRLPNGNTFIDEGETGRLFEVAPDGEIVWEYINPFFWPVGPGVMTNNVYRAWRVPPDWPTFR